MALPYPLLLLDYDGTLAETRPAILRSLSEAFNERGIVPPGYEALEAQLGRGGTLYEFYKAVVPDAEEGDATSFVRAYRQHYDRADEEETFLFDGAEEMLQYLQKAGYCLVVASNKHGPTLEKSIDRFGLRSFFSASFGAVEGVARKPEPAMWTERVAPLFPQFQKKDVLLLGDTTADLAFARNTGLDVCWAEYGHGTKEACLALEPRYRIAHLSDFVPLLEQLRQTSSGFSRG